MDIRRHGILQILLRAPLTGLWIVTRFLLVPFLYVPYKLGIKACWAYRIDAAVKQWLLPLTERADRTERHDVKPAIDVGAPIPDVGVKQRGELVSLRSIAGGKPLLLVCFRGSWCPYSRLHMADIASELPRLRELGVEVLAVSMRRDERWWRAHGVDTAVAADRNGKLFDALGVKAPQNVTHRVWGAMVPHESVFLFDREGKLVSSDVRRVSNTTMAQRFLATREWVARAGALPAHVIGDAAVDAMVDTTPLPISAGQAAE